MLAHIHPSRLWFTYETRPIFNDTAYPGSESGAGQGPPGAQSPFARNRCYLLRRGVLHHIREHYSSFIAHTGSCARPKPSCRLGLNLVRQVFVDCCKSLLGSWSFPTLSLQSLRRCLDPYPAVSPWCICSLLPRRQRPYLRRHRFGTPNYPHNATSTGNFISGLQSFTNVQAPTLDRPPGCTHRSSIKATGRPGRLHHA
jgi:hypothetical protein